MYFLTPHYRKQLLCRVPAALAKALLHSAKALPSAALGKGPSAKFLSSKGSLPSAFYRTLGKGFAECLRRLSAKKSYCHGGFITNGCFAVSPRKTLGKELSAPKPTALGKDHLCRVPNLWHSSKICAECQNCGTRWRDFFVLKLLYLLYTLFWSLS